ncbi:bifunctional protein-serine/threonine kinase/phosphatase [Rhodopseudomonas sp. BR0C11]|uniref:bifunctional protein-serine/threonine kinase/phosphatase n=1 Tax=Rhodopseudomonas sp. BR0C11 TaxID=2269370 RepID=UPI0013E04287|nr:bifunctional protein-serine/threonine kinase/phosphatase [Rhodopseudomonas sp. BR0C11]NEV77652.1 bifunctional protein-serine/threonine kinase/phosphatase [Rhodopseudomonas sp. BR0C11]
MAQQLTVSIGQASSQGRKPVNQDFYGALIPAEPLLTTKGIALALADGISSSDVSQVASESAVKSFLTDYYCTSEAWSVKSSAQRVIAATNSWLHAETRRSDYRYDRDKGYVCTLSALVLKGAAAHLFHIGDSRIYRLAGASLEQLTEDHRVRLSAEQSYLGRALGVNPQVEIDYLAVPVAPGDLFVLATDGVYEHITQRFVVQMLRDHAGDLDAAARAIIGEAFANGSDDNLTVQLVRIETVPDADSIDLFGRAADLPPPLLEPRAEFDGYRIVRELHGSSRSHIYLASDLATEQLVALKIPSADLRDDPDYRKRFMLEEWAARRIDSPHVLKPCAVQRPRSYLYVAFEYIEGQTLAQWMIDHPRAELETVRGLIEQIARGLYAFHRKEMVHQDLRPANVLIDRSGTVKIIDFGSVRVAGVAELGPAGGDELLGTVQYMAPEYFAGQGGSALADQFSLGVIAYQMLTGRLPYGAELARANQALKSRKLRYSPAADHNAQVPVWVDRALQRAVSLEPAKRYPALSEFVHDLRHPRADYLDARPQPLAARNPLLFWQLLSALLGLIVVALLARLHGSI